MFALDTDASIEILRSRHPKVLTQYKAFGPQMIVLPSIVAELLVGAEKSVRPNAKGDTNAFIARHTVVPFGAKEMREYARIRAGLETAGMKIGGNDLIVAATALAQNLTLVTHNVREFSRVSGLRIIDWHV